MLSTTRGCDMPNKKKHSLEDAANDPNSSAFQRRISAATQDEINSSLLKKFSGKRNTMFMLAAYNHTKESMRSIAKSASTRAVSHALRQQNANDQTGMVILAVHQSSAGFRAIVKKADYETVTALLRNTDQTTGGNKKDTIAMQVARYQSRRGFRAVIAKSPLIVKEIYPSMKYELAAKPSKTEILEDMEFIVNTKATAAKHPQQFLDFMVATLPKKPHNIHEHKAWKKILDSSLKVIPDTESNKAIRDQLLALSYRVYYSALRSQVPLTLEKSYEKEISPKNISPQDNFLIATLMSQRQETYDQHVKPKPHEKIAYQINILQRICYAAQKGSEPALHLLVTYKERMRDLIELHKERLQYHLDSQGPTYANLFSHVKANANTASNYRICKDIMRSNEFDTTMIDNALDETSASHIKDDKALVQFLTEMKNDMRSVMSLQEIAQRVEHDAISRHRISTIK
jgi:hypothetical protein